MSIFIRWFPPSWFQIKYKDKIIYIDPACAALPIKPKTVVPMHFKKKGNPQEFKKRLEAKSKIKVILLKIGETYHLK